MENILIIKLGSSGDVLRTTAILPGIKDKYPESELTWLVAKDCACVLEGNPYIDEVVFAPYGIDAFEGRQFSMAFNLDNDRASSSFMNTVDALRKKGFALDDEGKVYAINPEAEEWHQMSLSNDLKKENTETYHDIIHDIAGLQRNQNRPILELAKNDMVFSEKFAKDNELLGRSAVIGVNLGGARRWKLKSPDTHKWVEIIKAITASFPSKVLLFSGKKEQDKYMEVLDELGGKVIGTGTDNPFGRFASLIGLCDVLITPDTLALHVGTALNKKIVALFGPTSSAEIELYGDGAKIDSGVQCLCCYKEECGKDPSCMDLIDVVSLVARTKELLSGR